MRRGDERGQAAILVLGVLLVGLLAVGVALDGTRLLIAHRDAANVADAAALAGASQIDEVVARRTGGLTVQLDPAAAERVAAEFAGRSAVVRATTDSVRVHVDEDVSMILLRFVGVARVGASAVARPRTP